MENNELEIVAKSLASEIDYNIDKVVSAKVMEADHLKVHVMAMSRLQSIPSHSTKTDAFLLGLEGEAILTIGNKLFDIVPGVYVPLPKDVPHAIKAVSDFKMMLVR